MNNGIFYGFALAVLSLAGLVFASALARRTRLLSFRVLIILVYTGTNLVSGVVHVLGLSQRVGYFDALNQLETKQLGEVVFLAALGLAAVTAGASLGISGKTLSSPRMTDLAPFDRSLIIVFVALIFPISLFALVRIREYAAGVQVFGGRIISVAGGVARFSFISSWMVWAISLSVIYLVFRTGRRQSLMPTFLLFGSMVAIASVFAWNGGRSAAVLMALPLIMVMAPRLRVNKRIVVASGSVIAIFYFALVARVTASRFAESRLSPTGVTDWVDWEWGRFSMLGWAVQFVDRNGYLYGETFIQRISVLADGIFRLLGSTSGDIAQRSSMDVAGESILNSSSAIYIVPGLSAEFFLNFGAFGIAIGYLILGRLCGWVDGRFDSSATPITRLMWAYVGVELVFRTITLDSGAAVTNLLFIGAPLIGAAAASHYASRRSEPTMWVPAASMRPRANAGRVHRPRGADL